MNWDVTACRCILVLFAYEVRATAEAVHGGTRPGDPWTAVALLHLDPGCGPTRPLTIPINTKTRVQQWRFGPRQRTERNPTLAQNPKYLHSVVEMGFRWDEVTLPGGGARIRRNLRCVGEEER